MSTINSGRRSYGAMAGVASTAAPERAYKYITKFLEVGAGQTQPPI